MIGRLILPALFVAGLAGCESTNLDPRWHYEYQDYLTKPHFRAFVVTGGTSRGLATAFGRSWGFQSAEAAIETALEECKKGEKRFIVIKECRVHSIGDIRLTGMTDKQIKRAITLYKSNRFATNEDLVTDTDKVMISGNEIKELYVSGAKLSGTYEDRTEFTIEHFSDGTATISWKGKSESGIDQGVWTVIGDKSCKKWNSLFDGIQHCWSVYQVGDGQFASYSDDRLVATWSVEK